MFSLMLFSAIGKDPTKEKMLEHALSLTDNLRDIPGTATIEQLRAFVADMIHTSVANALAAVDAAAIVFAHTVIDTTLNDLLRVTSIFTSRLLDRFSRERKTLVDCKGLAGGSAAGTCRQRN